MTRATGNRKRSASHEVAPQCVQFERRALMDEMDYSSAKYPTFPRKFDQNAPLGEEEAPFDEDELARRYRDFSGPN